MELKRKLEHAETILMLDIRDAPDYADWHIPGSVNLPVYAAVKEGRLEPLKERLSDLTHESEIVTICYAGVVSQQAATLLHKLGLQARNLEGGMRGWSTVWSVARMRLTQDAGATLLQIRRNGKGCLSYLLGSQGSALIVDPNLEPSVYLELAEQENLQIKFILETHVHADHLSRARALAELTKAQLLLPYGAADRVLFNFEALQDKQEFQLGAIRLRALATPGHTHDSFSYLLDDVWLLTGDTLFIESIGRPDLEAGDAGATPAARQLYESLQRLLQLSASLNILPAHFSGPIGFDREPITATLAQLKNQIDLLKASPDVFVKTVTSRLPAKPPNYERIIALNEGRMRLSEIEDLSALEAGPNRCAVEGLSLTR
jgi:glyoxylase-like metal-dependent hydrolase (beta-lactamase superfamily II)